MNFDSLSLTLPIMAKAMGVIFGVTIVLILIIMLMNKAFKK